VGATLIDAWLGDAPAVAVVDEASVALVREEVRARARDVGMAATAMEALATAASELAHNQLRHAGGGRVAVRAVERGVVPGVEVVAADRGPGIADAATALSAAGKGAAGGGLGVGLAGAARLAHELDFDVRLGEGTLVIARTFCAPVARNEVAIVGRALAGERESGDDAAFVRTARELVVAVADGLGHGSVARVPARTAVDAVRATPGRGPVEALAECDRALAGTRGAVMAIGIIDLTARAIRHAGSGNIGSALFGAGGERRFVTRAHVLGSMRRGGAPIQETALLASGQVLAMWSDGVSSRVTLGSDPALLREPLVVVAERVLRDHARGTDDALVLLVR
jgi:anti-sigma regulatory factor (Ser/Thr protein kinase)